MLVPIPYDLADYPKNTLTPASSAGQALALSHDGRGDMLVLISTYFFKALTKVGHFNSSLPE